MKKKLESQKQSKFLKKLKSAAKEYDEYLEKGRENVEKVGKELRTGGKIIGKEIRKTKDLFEDVRKPTSRFLQSASIGVQRSVRFKPTSGQSNPERIARPRPFESRDLWAGKSTRGIIPRKYIVRRTRGKLPRLF